MNRPVDLLLPRLVSVRQYGDGWRADCPVGHSSRGALSVGERDDGAVLLRCFAGCSASDVVAAVGLSLADLFPERLRDDSPEGRRAARTAFKQSAWAAALGVLTREADVVLVSAAWMLRGAALPDEDRARLELAAERIHGAREALV